jgi:hypothetical protein
MLTKLFLGVFALALAWLWWRWTSVGRGARKRDEALLRELDPVFGRFDSGTPVSVSDIEPLAAKSHLRSMVHAALQHMGKGDLFPPQYLTRVADAEATLARWLMHPNELQAAPEAIEYLQSVPSDAWGRPGEFLVFRYRMPADHWAPGWLLGLAGPYFAGDEPYCSHAGAFSRAGDRDGETNIPELVSWYAGMMQKKSPS